MNNINHVLWIGKDAQIKINDPQKDKNKYGHYKQHPGIDLPVSAVAAAISGFGPLGAKVDGIGCLSVLIEFGIKTIYITGILALVVTRSVIVSLIFPGLVEVKFQAAIL
jgi:hypothetical protein